MIMINRIKEFIIDEKDNLGIYEYAFIKTDNVIFSDEVRKICAKNVCGMYGKSWACPPAVGTMEHCRKQCDKYENAFVLTTVSVLEDKYDVNKWREAAIQHETVTDKVLPHFKSSFKTVLALSTEGCSICESCTYPNSPCRFPARMHPATEGYGILVTELSKKCSINYNNGSNTITYFSIIFFNN